jgi:hypothetical protein
LHWCSGILPLRDLGCVAGEFGVTSKRDMERPGELVANATRRRGHM